MRVTVTPVNDAPEVVDDEAETPEDVAVVSRRAGQRRRPAAGGVGDGDTLSYSGGLVGRVGADGDGSGREADAVAGGHRHGDGDGDGCRPYYGLTAVRTFAVSVGDLLVRDVLTDALAALGRAHLSSARVAIGRRLEYDAGTTRLMRESTCLSSWVHGRMGRLCVPDPKPTGRGAQGDRLRIEEWSVALRAGLDNAVWTWFSRERRAQSAERRAQSFVAFLFRAFPNSLNSTPPGRGTGAAVRGALRGLLAPLLGSFAGGGEILR